MTSTTDAAIDAARAALVEEAGIPDVGEHLGAVAEDTGAVTHRFASLRPGYVGWAWSVTVNQLADSPITVDEIANMVVYVASKEASATNGAALRAEGGIVQTIA